MFKLAERIGDLDGLYCGPDGLYLGSSPLTDRTRGSLRLRAEPEISALLAAAYDPPPDVGSLLSGFRRVAGALQDGDMARAMIAALHLKLGKITEDGLTRLARAETLLKYGFNPDEPRDWHGRWTTEGGGDAEEGGSDASSTAATARRPQAELVLATRTWENYPNSDFRNQLALAEGSGNKPNFGYGEANPQSGALGRYQMTPSALRAAGMMDGQGNWTGKYGIYSTADFLANPDAQEMALTDFLNDIERQLGANGALNYIGITISGLRASFTVTLAGLLAAAHREGAPATRDYLKMISSYGFASRGRSLTRLERAIETRLRIFAGRSYE